MDITLHNKLRNNSWAPYNPPTFHEDDDQIHWPNTNTYPHHDLIQENHSNPQLINLDDQVNFKHELPDQNQEDIQEQEQLVVGGELGEGEEELGPMKEMMFKIASMQPVDIDPATIHRPKRRNVRISDDPQSVAARHRRERISEKIRILQRLVPGGTKMDTASMLDEAIRYVKFLKRQIRLLQSSNHHQPPPFAPPPPEDHWVTTTPAPTTTTTTQYLNSSNSYYFGGNNVDNNDHDLEGGGHNDFNHKLFNFGQD